MYAVIVKETDAVEFNVDEWNVGDRIEVLGFVPDVTGVLQVVFSDDDGRVRELPVWAIRMTRVLARVEPVVDHSYPPPDNWWCSGCGSWLSQDVAQTHSHAVEVPA